MSSLKERLAALAAKKREELAGKSDAEIFGIKEEPIQETKPVTTKPVTPKPVEPTTAPIESAVPTPKMSSVVDMENTGDYFDVKLKLKELEEALEAEVPGFNSILFDVHKALSNDPNCITVFNDEEIGLVVKALIKHTEISVTTTAPKTARRTQKFDASEL